MREWQVLARAAVKLPRNAEPRLCRRRGEELGLVTSRPDGIRSIPVSSSNALSGQRTSRPRSRQSRAGTTDNATFEEVVNALWLKGPEGRPPQRESTPPPSLAFLNHRKIPNDDSNEGNNDEEQDDTWIAGGG